MPRGAGAGQLKARPRRRGSAPPPPRRQRGPAAPAAPSITFNELKAVLSATDGNLSVQARKLEDAGYVTCTKGFDGRRPRTEYRLSPAGRRELGRYVNHMEALIRVTRDTLER